MKIQELGREYLAEAEGVGERLRRLEEEYRHCGDLCKLIDLERRMEIVGVIYHEMCNTGNYLLRHPMQFAGEQN